MRISTLESRNRFFQTDFSQTNIEGSNCKKIPSENIITRRSNSSSNSSSSKGSQSGTPKNSLTPSAVESPNNTQKSSPSLKGSPKSSTKSSPIAGLKRILSNSPANVFKPIKFGSRKNISVSSSSPPEPSSPDKSPIKTLTSWEKIINNDSIDKTIIENNDLKKIFVRSYNIDVHDDFWKGNSASLNYVNIVPKPPRMSLDIEKENPYELQMLMKRDDTNGLPPLPDSPTSKLSGNSTLTNEAA